MPFLNNHEVRHSVRCAVCPTIAEAIWYGNDQWKVGRGYLVESMSTDSAEWLCSAACLAEWAKEIEGA